MEEYAEDRKFEPRIRNLTTRESAYSATPKAATEMILINPQRDHSKISGYEETIVADPHGEGLDLMLDDPVEAEKTILKSSLWLIHYKCITKYDLKDNFRSAINATPPRTQVCILIDAPETEHDDIEAELDEITDSKNVYTVKSKPVLRNSMRQYLDMSANPKRGREEVIKWNNNVCDLIDARS